MSLSYFPGASPLHRLDARCKAAALALATLGLFRGEGVELCAFALLLPAAVACSGLPLREAARKLRGFALFSGGVALFQVLLTAAGGAAPGFPAVAHALFGGARLFLMAGFGVIFSATTRPREVREAAAWFLSFIPGVPARRVGLMAGLVAGALPGVLRAVATARLAARARFADGARKALPRLGAVALPAFRRTLLRADSIALALAARGFREDLPARLPPPPASHLAVPLVFFALILWRW